MSPGFCTDKKLLIRSFYVKCFTLSDLFAGKMHALPFRKWGQNVKGRDWYDMEWYIRKGVNLNLHHLALRVRDSGDWSKEEMTEEDLIGLLVAKITSVNMERVKADISRFIPPTKNLTIWSVSYFLDLINHIKIVKH